MSDAQEEHVQNVICDSISNGVFAVDDGWRITTFNRAATEINRVPAEEDIRAFLVAGRLDVHTGGFGHTTNSIQGNLKNSKTSKLQ